MTRVVVVGASVAGVRTAQALRAEGYAGELVVLDAEPELPYDKPPLSKSVLLHGEAAGVPLLTRAEAEASAIELRLGERAMRLEPRPRRLITSAGQIDYDHLVVATGAQARALPWPVPDEVHVLRTLQHARRLREDLLTGGHLVVVGAGFIGAEVASTARALGVEVTVVDPLPTPMSRSLDREVAGFLAELHREHGVRLRLGVGVTGIGGAGRDLRVRLADGSTLEATCVLVGIGALPRLDWLRASGLRLDDGLVCDEHCRSRTAPEVWCAGDAARWFHPGRKELVRLEHWTNAVEQAAVVAHNITHPHDLRPYSPQEYVWSEQHGWKLQVAGLTHGSRPRAIVGAPDEGRFAALYSSDGVTLGGCVTVNWPRALIECRRALAAGAALDDVHHNLEALPVARVGARGGS
jgi:NADPH-dependent 2,4-dienoyl-CoA reductase/sulfur reductase-like enzyme